MISSINLEQKKEHNKEKKEHNKEKKEHNKEKRKNHNKRPLIVFGDSLSDSGNERNLIGAFAFKSKYPQSTNGTLTNGLVWPEQLALRMKLKYKLGFPALAKNNKNNKKKEFCCRRDTFTGHTLINYAVVGTVISPNTAVFANNQTAGSVSPQQILSAQVNLFISQFFSFLRAENKKFKKAKCLSGRRSKCFDVIFMAGANDWFDRILPTVLARGGYVQSKVPNVPSVSTLVADSMLTTPPNPWLPPDILSNLQSDWAAISQVISEQGCNPQGGCCCSEKQSARAIKFLVANVPDLTATKLFTQTFVPIFEAYGYTPENAVLFVTNMLTAYSQLLATTIANWNMMAGGCRPYVRLLDILSITEAISNDFPKYGISTGPEQPVWNSDNSFTTFTFNTNWTMNACGDGAALNDPIHPSKEVHYAFSKFIHTLLTLDNHIPRCPPPIPPACILENKHPTTKSILEEKKEKSKKRDHKL